MLVGAYLRELRASEAALGSVLGDLAATFEDEPDVTRQCRRFASHARERRAQLEGFSVRYRDLRGPPAAEHAPAETDSAAVPALALLNALRGVFVLSCEIAITWTLVSQAAQGARDDDLLALAQDGVRQLEDQERWLQTRMKQAAPQTLVVA